MSKSLPASTGIHYNRFLQAIICWAVFLQIGINTLILQSTEEAFVGRVNGVLYPLFTGGMVAA